MSFFTIKHCQNFTLMKDHSAGFMVGKCMHRSSSILVIICQILAEFWRFIDLAFVSVVFIPCHTIVAGFYGFMLDIRVSSVVHPSLRFSFSDDNLSKHQWIFTKLGMCIDIVEIWFGIANGQILSIFYGVICPRHAHIFVSR